MTVFELAAIARGVDLERSNPSPASTAWSTPTRRCVSMADERRLDRNGRKRSAGNRDPFTLSGAMCPITIAGALAQQNAEALGVIALSQIVNPGTPMVYGGLPPTPTCAAVRPPSVPPNIRAQPGPAVSWRGVTGSRFVPPTPTRPTASMRRRPGNRRCHCGAQSWGMPNHQACRRLARGRTLRIVRKIHHRYRHAANDARNPDATAVDESTLALDAIREAGHGGHFFATAHTRRVTPRRFTSRWYPTGAISKPGAKTARKPPSSAPTSYTGRTWRVTTHTEMDDQARGARGLRGRAPPRNWSLRDKL